MPAHALNWDLEIPLTDRRIISFYTESYCGYLALRLQELTGASIRILQQTGGWGYGHACVELLDGRMLDIEGPCPAEAMLLRWQHRLPGSQWVEGLSQDEMREELFAWGDEGEELITAQLLELALVHAQRLLAEHGIGFRSPSPADSS